MGTRDRILGDVNIMGPMEMAKTEYEEIPDGSKEQKEEDEFVGVGVPKSKGKFTESSYSSMFKPQFLQEKENPNIMMRVKRDPRDKTADKDDVDIINDQLIDIHKYKFNDRFKNFIFSSCPIIPRFHSTFGEPLDR